MMARRFMAFRISFRTSSSCFNPIDMWLFYGFSKLLVVVAMLATLPHAALIASVVGGEAN